MAPKFLMFYLLLSLLFCDLVCTLWWSLGSRMDYNRICRKRGRKKSKDPLNFLCRKEPTTVNLLLTGRQQAMKECQHQFRNHRWNCTDNKRSLKRIFSKETPESAFLNSIMSAVVTHEITSACSRGDLIQCSCIKNTYETDASIYSQTIARNIRKKRKEARAILSKTSGLNDVQGKKSNRRGKKRGRKGRRKLTKEERERKRLARQERQQRLSNMLPGSITSPETVTPSGEGVTIIDFGEKPVIPGVPDIGIMGKDWHWSGCDDNVAFGYRVAKELLEKFLRGRESHDIKSIVMLRNNEAGRLAVHNHLRPHCKCHGLSGSCSHRTCWKRMPSRRAIGIQLREKYNNAIKVIPSNDAVTIMPANDSFRRPGEEDLVYLDDSPDFCRPDKKSGSLGTVGRMCNATSEGEDGCQSLCCRRPYLSETKMETENCRCRFTFCCEVTCEKCRVRRHYSYCT